MFRFLCCCAIAVCAVAIGLAFGQSGRIREGVTENREQQYGLRFASYPEVGSKRTSLVLENNEAIDLSAGLTMTFDLYLRPDNVFGYVFRMVIDGKHNVDLLYSSGIGDSRYPALAIQDSLYRLADQAQSDRWIPVKVELAKETNEIRIQYGHTRAAYPLDLTQTNQVKIAFGKCPIEPCASGDIPSMDIRAVVLARDGKTFRKWKLREHGEDHCLDSIQEVQALVANGKWLIDQHVQWADVYTATVSNNTNFAFDGDRSLYIVQPDSNVIYALDLASGMRRAIPVAGGKMVSNSPNQLLYDAKSHQLVSYNLDEKTHAFFSFDSRTWSEAPVPTKEPTYQNNTGNYSSHDSTIYAFGGYGFFRYNNYLVRQGLFSNTQERIPLDGIVPRYSAASSIIGDTLYIFGGRGNPSGRQVMNPRNYFDLYAVDLATSQVTKLWELTDVKHSFLPGEHMVYDEHTGYFYVFSDLEGGSLMRFNRQGEQIEVVSGFIHENLEGLYLYMDLYYSPTLQKLFGVFYKQPSETTYRMAVYSINFPPLAVDGVRQQVVAADSTARIWSISNYYLWGTLVLLLFVGLVWWWVGRWRNGVSAVPTSLPGPEISQPTVFEGAAIGLLGSFKVTNRDGNDITPQFTPILKHFLCLLLLHGQRGSKGISVRKLLESLWPDKSEESARNNRNVYLSKLRSLSEQVGHLDVAYHNEYMSIQLGSDIACDYLESVALMDEIEAHPDGQQGTVTKLVTLLLRGALLPGVEAEWLDGFKSSFSDKVISCLTKLSRNPIYQQSDDLLLTIADILFIHDALNEEALHLKCSIYYRAGKKGLAKSVYDHYCKGYMNMLGEAFRPSLLDVVNGRSGGD